MKDPIVEKILQQLVLSWYNQGSKKPYTRIMPFMSKNLQLVRLVFEGDISNAKSEAFRLMARTITPSAKFEPTRAKPVKLEKIVRQRPNRSAALEALKKTARPGRLSRNKKATGNVFKDADTGYSMF